MKSISTNITFLSKSPILIVEREEYCFNPVIHSHPEFELVYIKKGFGKRVIGNNINEFKEDELVLVGPNLPHAWMSDKSFENDNVKRSRELWFISIRKFFQSFFIRWKK